MHIPKGKIKRKYIIEASNGKEQAEKILNQIDELMIWFENLFPSMEVSIP